MRALSIIVAAGLASACGAPSDVDPDAAIAVDAAHDAPLAGRACPTRAAEAARIARADIFPSDVGPAFYRSATASFYTADSDGDADADADLVVLEYVSSTGSSYVCRIRLFRREETGFAAAIESSITLPASGAELDVLADVDGDHRKDLIIGYTTDFPRTPYLYVARQSSAGTFALQPSPREVSVCRASMDQRFEALVVVDVDRDGKDDVLTTVSIGGLGSAPAGLSLALGTATGLGASVCVASSTVTATGYPAALAAAKLLRAGDFDGDGVTDLIATSYAGGIATMQLYAAHGAPDLRAVAGTAVPPTSRLLVDHVSGRAHDGLLTIDVSADHTDLTRYAIAATSGSTS
ncbi:MAG: VCBS repeat-containing protein [Myxococcales bacterium]|nr:VCBS repeat-containing protein [Myxococcales bacterium]MBK7196747.1 VCBS repeat-containing protein [Myxococcales bacterium]MBP6843841.1 VCBS repeat-containing protein [Kofleriaceae bacterium]